MKSSLEHFRAYLRVKTANADLNNLGAGRWFFYYLILSFSIVLLPNDILTRYPFLAYFTDFMDFIPAVNLLESKSFAPELCTFYASYMIVFGVVLFVIFTTKLSKIILFYSMRPYHIEMIKLQEEHKSKRWIALGGLKIIFAIVFLIVLLISYVFFTKFFVPILGVPLDSADEEFVIDRLEMLLFTMVPLMSLACIWGLLSVVALDFVLRKKQK